MYHLRRSCRRKRMNAPVLELVTAPTAAILPSCAAAKVFSHYRERRKCPGSSGLWLPEPSRWDLSSSGRFARRCLGAGPNGRVLQANRICRFCLLVIRADRHCRPARVLVRACVRRCTDLLAHGLVAFQNSRLEVREEGTRARNPAFNRHVRRAFLLRPPSTARRILKAPSGLS
jgi:hypothetical protein